MTITVNGNIKQLKAPLPLEDLISQVCSIKHVIAEVNGEIIQRPDWKNRSIADGDRIELITFVGGG